MTNGYKYGAASLTIDPIIFTRPQLVPFMVVFTVIEASPATAVNASGIKLSKLSMAPSEDVALFVAAPKVWYRLFRIEATVVEAAVVVVLVEVEGAAVDEEKTERIEAKVEVLSPLSFSAEFKESFTSPGNCCNLASIDASEVTGASASGVASMKSPTVLLTKRFRMFDCGASTFVPSPTFKLALIGSHWLSGSR